MWLKDNSTIENQDSYKIMTGPAHGKDNQIESTLMVYNFTNEDQGTFTCYCYYNTSLIMTNKRAIFDKKSVKLHTNCAIQKGKKHAAI